MTTSSWRTINVSRTQNSGRYKLEKKRKQVQRAESEKIKDVVLGQIEAEKEPFTILTLTVTVGFWKFCPRSLLPGIYNWSASRGRKWQKCPGGRNCPKTNVTVKESFEITPKPASKIDIFVNGFKKRRLAEEVPQVPSTMMSAARLGMAINIIIDWILWNSEFSKVPKKSVLILAEVTSWTVSYWSYLSTMVHGWFMSCRQLGNFFGILDFDFFVGQNQKRDQIEKWFHHRIVQFWVWLFSETVWLIIYES